MPCWTTVAASPRERSARGEAARETRVGGAARLRQGYGEVSPERFARRRTERSPRLDWLASRSSFRRACGPPSLKLRRATFARDHERRLVRPARLERATSWFVAGRRESTGGSGRPLPQCFRWLGNRPRPLENTSSRRGLSAVHQSCDPLAMGIRPACFGVERASFSKPIVSRLSVVLSSPEGSSMGLPGS